MYFLILPVLYAILSTVPDFVMDLAIGIFVVWRHRESLEWRRLALGVSSGVSAVLASFLARVGVGIVVIDALLCYFCGKCFWCGITLRVPFYVVFFEHSLCLE